MDAPAFAAILLADGPDVRAAESTVATALAAFASPAASDSAAASAAASSSPVPPPAVIPALAGYVLLPAVLPPLPAEIVSVCDDALKDSLVRLLAQIHPDSRLLPCALPGFARICNRIVHMTLLGADLNQGRLDLYVPLPILQLHRYHRSESLMARSRFESGPGSLLPLSGRLMLTLQSADRWLAEFRTMHPESTLELSVASRIELLAGTEFLVAELLELSGNAARDVRQSGISVTHLFRTIQSDPEHLMLANYMRQPFEAGTVAPLSAGAVRQKQKETLDYATPIVRRMAEEHRAWMQSQEHNKMPRGAPRHAPFLQATAEDFARNEAHMRTLNAACWYNDAARVAHYAQLYARGELQSPVSDFFASFGIRPVDFFGFARPSQFGSRIREARAFFAFELWDRDSELWWPLLSAVRLSAHLPMIDVVAAWSGAHLVRAPLDPSLLTEGWIDEAAPIAPTALCALRWTNAPQQLPNFGPRQERAAQTAQADRVDGTANESAAATSLASAASSSPPPAAVTDAQYEERRERFREQMAAAVLLASFSQFGASLYSANHPLRARVAFTAAAVDVASAALGLPTLPTVLLDLIGEYDPADLPYIPAASAASSDGTAAETAALAALLRPLSIPDQLPDVAADHSAAMEFDAVDDEPIDWLTRQGVDEPDT